MFSSMSNAMPPLADSLMCQNMAAKPPNQELEIAREINVAAVQASLLRQGLERLYDRLGAVMRPASPSPEDPVSGLPPQTAMGQSICALTMEFRRANDVVDGILQRLELQ